MQIIENLKIKEKVYIKKLENGLTLMCIPKKDIQKKYMMWATHYGSNESKFIIPGEEEITEVPDGVAHFLEHKLFEQENGTNSLDTLTSIGAEANAYTTNNHTAYLFECTDNFYEAMDELMDYVQKPFFTDENVEKEKGIIGQEIKMYQDYPDWEVYMNALKCMYHNTPIKIDIAGSIESISKIDKEILYKCYNTFYNPSNMVIVVAGDFVPEDIFDEIEKRVIEKPLSGEIKRIYDEEPEEIVKAFEVANSDVSKPLWVIGVKDKREPETESKNEIIKKHIAINILLNLLVGNSSKLYKKLYDEGLVYSVPGMEYEFTNYYAHILLTGQSKEPKKILEFLKLEINKIKEEGIDKEAFERTKKNIYGSLVKEYNDISIISRNFLSDYFKGLNSFDYLEEIEGISVEYLDQILKNVFKEDKMVISIVEK